MISDASKQFIRDQFLGHVVSHDNPVIHATCGIPGAGKSYFVDRQLKHHLFPVDAYVFNPDRVMVSLDEYRDLSAKQSSQQAYEVLELPARELAYAMAHDVVGMRGNIIKDMGCANPLSLDLIKEAKNQGYGIHMYYIQCDIDEAFRRIAQRDFQISKDEVKTRLKLLEDLIPSYKEIVDTFDVIDNTNID